MMYPYMTLDDNTEIVHSEMKPDGTVKVYIEQAVDGGFHSAVCMLPAHEWSQIKGFTDSEMERFKRLVRNNAHLILAFARDGGFANATVV